MFYKIKRFIGKILRIIDYIPVLWRDEDWDFEYIFPILRKKVDRVGKCIKNNNIILNSENVYQETRDLLQAIDNYSNCDKLYTSIYDEPEKYEKFFNSEREYFIKMQEFEIDRWNEIWDMLKKKGLGWWD